MHLITALASGKKSHTLDSPGKLSKIQVLLAARAFYATNVSEIPLLQGTSQPVCVGKINAQKGVPDLSKG